MEIKVSEEIKKACPQFAGIAIRATVENTAYSGYGYDSCHSGGL